MYKDTDYESPKSVYIDIDIGAYTCIYRKTDMGCAKSIFKRYTEYSQLYQSFSGSSKTQIVRRNFTLISAVQHGSRIAQW